MTRWTRSTVALGSALAIALGFASGCSEPESKPTPITKPAPTQPEPTPEPEPAPEPEPEAPPSAEELAARGRTVYMSNCIACHNIDPTKEGALGPTVHGSSAALLEARVIHGAYPEGYTPKRDTKAMIPLPHLEREIAALEAFLAH